MKVSTLKRISLILILLQVVFNFTTFSQVTQLWTNPITAANPSSTNPYTNGDVKHANVTVSGISFAGVSAASGTDLFNTTSWSGSGSIVLTTYFNWTITPATGYRMSLTSFAYTATAGSKISSTSEAV